MIFLLLIGWFVVAVFMVCPVVTFITVAIEWSGVQIKPMSFEEELAMFAVFVLVVILCVGYIVVNESRDKSKTSVKQ